MVQEIDIYRTAKIVIEQHGDGALLEAMAKVEHFRSIGDEDGQHLWWKISNAIEFFCVPATLFKGSIH